MKRTLAGIGPSERTRENLEILYARKAYIEGLIRSLERYERLRERSLAAKRAP